MVEPGDHPGVRVPPPLIILAALLAGLAVDGRLSGLPPAGPARIALASLAAAAGAVLVAAALGLFRRAGTNPEPWKPSSALVRGGIYRRSRNPMYLGMLLVYVAAAILFASPAAGLLLVPLFLVLDRLVVAREEAYLTRRFGEKYEEYRRSVRRWL
jgi:protein-S-isoprenylcysteine O-methyltransferase Ste14